MSDSPASLLYDHHGNRIMVQDGEEVGVDLPAILGGVNTLQHGIPVAGLDRNDDVTYRHLRLNEDGYLVVFIPQLDSAELGVVGVNFIQEAIADTESYYLLIDSDNRASDVAAIGTGPYKHTSYDPNTEILFSTLSITATKALAQSSWSIWMGVITRIDGTDADVTWTEVGSLYIRGQDNATINRQWVTAPEFLDYGIRSGDTHALASNHKTTTALINTGIPMPNIAGVGVTASVGDIVLRVEKITGGGTFDLEYNVWYRTHEETP